MSPLPTDGIELQVLADPTLEDPFLIEGLPGVGHVGKLAVEHLLEEFESQPVRRIISEHFPPQVSVDRSSTAALPAAELHHLRIGDQDTLVLLGDHQAVTPMGHYRLTTAVLNGAESFGVTEVYPLGGMPTGEIQEVADVVGAVSRTALVDEFEEYGVSFREREPKGGIVGVSGLLLGLGAERDMDVVCLMGETSGYLVDPRSAKAVLEVLEAALGFSIEYEQLEARAEKMEQMIRRVQEKQQADIPGDEDLRYIG